MIMPKHFIDKYIEEYRKKAHNAYMNYQGSGSPRYLKTQEKYEGLADTLQAASDASETIARERNLRMGIEEMYESIQSGEMTDIDDLTFKIEELHEYIKLQRGY